MKGLTVLDRELVRRALRCMEQAYDTQRPFFGDPQILKDFLRLKIGHLDYEAFHVTYLDSQHRFIEHEILFRGTLSQTSVYPREVVKGVLMRDAASVVFAHNHPSGEVEPSRDDQTLTAVLCAALKLVDVRVLDHIIVGPTNTFSFAERGLL